MKRKRRHEDDDPLTDLLAGLIVLYLGGLVLFYFYDRVKFWKYLAEGIVGLVIIIVAIKGLDLLRERTRQRKVANIFARIRAAQLEGHIKNFIERFGFEKGKNVWRYRNRAFDWDRINDLHDFLEQKGAGINRDDLYTLLRVYISEAEHRLTLESLQGKPQKFISLTGAEFEQLLYRLFSAMGYAVQHTGQSGDQGGDLIANKEGERILIQAKRYGDAAVGNKAVQEAVAARNFYKCTKAIVVTTSHFTPEAIELARANSVELTLKEQLQEMLLKYLKESWG